MGAEGVDDVVGANGDVVIAEAGEALRGALSSERTSAATPAARQATWSVAGTAADEVAGEEDEFGVEIVDGLDGRRRNQGSVYSSRWMSESWTKRKPTKASGRLRRVRVRSVTSISWRAWVPA